MVGRWDCIFIGHIDSNGRIYLTKPQEYGLMYLSRDGTPAKETKVRKSIPKQCGSIEGSSNENQILIATAFASVCNRKKLKLSDGLVLRGFEGETPLEGLQTALIRTQGKSLRIRESTGWLVYISPEEKFYSIIGKYLGEELSTQQYEKIRNAIQYIENEYKSI